MFLPIIKPAFRLALKIASLILFFLTLIAAYGGRVNPDIFPYFAWLTLILPYLAMASAIICIGWIISGSFFTAGIGILALVASWGPISSAFPMHFSKSSEDSERTFRFMTWNIIHGWDQTQNIESNADIPNQKGNSSFQYVINSGADLVNLQEIWGPTSDETPNTAEFIDSLRKVYPYVAGDIHTDFKLFSKYPVKKIKDFNRYSHYVASMPWGKLNIINIHLPSYSLTDKERMVMKELISVKKTEDGIKELKGSIRSKLNESFRYRALVAEELKEYINSVKGPLIVAGDLNDVPESYAYRLMRSADLSDAYIDTSFGHLITYNKHLFYFHLDQIFYRKGPLQALKVSKGKIKYSDHYPLIAEFEWLPN